MSDMFCFHCADNARNEGCTVRGVCGKDADTAALHDLLLYAAVGLAQVEWKAVSVELGDTYAARLVFRAFAETSVLANTDPDAVERLLREVVAERQRRVQTLQNRGISRTLDVVSDIVLGTTREELLEQARMVGLRERWNVYPKELVKAQELVIYGLRGVASEAVRLVKLPQALVAQVLNIIDGLVRFQQVRDLIALAHQIGEVHLRQLGALAEGVAERWGAPEAVALPTTRRSGKAVLVSGDHPRILEQILRLAPSHRVSVYTHGALLTAHAYPGLGKQPALAGHVVGAWYDTKGAFASFPGAVLVVSEKLSRPGPELQGRLFTAHTTGWAGVPHVDNSFSAVFAAAREGVGFTGDEKVPSIIASVPDLVALEPEIVAAFADGTLKRALLIAGEDNRAAKGAWVEKMVAKLPAGTLLLTVGSVSARVQSVPEGVHHLHTGGNSALAGVVRLWTALKARGIPTRAVVSWHESRSIALLLAARALGDELWVAPTIPPFMEGITPELWPTPWKVLPHTDSGLTRWPA